MFKIFVDSNCKIGKKDINAEIISNPAEYEQAIAESEGQVFVITPSSYISTNYETALEAADEAAKQGGTGMVHIMDLDLSGMGALTIIKELIRLENIGLPFDEIVGRIEVFRNRMVPFCV